MARLRLYYPLASIRINQGFGASPEYYAKFHDSNGNPLKGHDGIDFFAPHGTPVYAAHDGMIHFERDAHGGEGMAIHAQEAYDDPAGYPITMYWHLCGDTDPKYPSPIPTDGKSYPVKTGDLIGYADNTGAPYESSGDHLHFGLFVVDAHENTQNIGNGFNGRIDAVPYFTGIYADTVQQQITLLKSLVAALTKLVSWLSAGK